MSLRDRNILGAAVAGAMVAMALLAATTAALRNGGAFSQSFSWFAGPTGPAEFGASVRSVINPESLRQWAIPQLESVAVGQNRPVPISQLPPELTALGARGGGIGPLADVGGTDVQRHVRVFWGFSFGNGYEILIGRTNLNLPTNRFCLRWVPGIYFIDPQRH